MAIPILRLRGILLSSLPANLSDADALAFQEDLLRRASASEARGAIVDLSAVDVTDSYLARVINETTTMMELLGVPVVVCGMQPDPALALVEMGRELLHVETALNLDQAMDKLERTLEARERGAE